MYPEKLLREIADLAVKHGFYVISDEIYEKLIYDGQKHVSIASLGEAIREQTIVVNGVSKSYAMTGWRIGYAAAPVKIAKAMSSFQSHSTSNANSIAQHAAAVAMTNGEAIIADMVKEFAARRDLLVRLIAETPLLKANTPEGAFYVMLNIPACSASAIRARRSPAATALPKCSSTPSRWPSCPAKHSARMTMCA